MKNILFIIPIIVGTIAFKGLNANAQTQPQNAGFENWESIGLGEDPTNWSSFNEFNIYNVPVMSFKTIEANSGTYALRIISDTATIPPPFGNSVLDTVMGIVTLGSLDLNNPGIPYTDKPAAINAYVKGTVMPTGSNFLIAKLSKWNSILNQRETVGQAIFVMQTSVANYTPVSAAFNYTLSYTPDTLVIMMLTGEGGSSGHIMPGNEFFIDDISLSGLVGINEISQNANLNVFPNPSNGVFNINSPTLISKIEIMNILGDVIYSAGISAFEFVVDINNQPKGIYFYKLQSASAIIKMGKLIIE